MLEIFSEFLTFCNLLKSAKYEKQKYEITAKYEKREKYLPVMHEAMCDNNFIVKCMFK